MQEYLTPRQQWDLSHTCRNESTYFRAAYKNSDLEPELQEGLVDIKPAVGFVELP
jgi:hypothetical protein